MVVAYYLRNILKKCWFFLSKIDICPGFIGKQPIIDINHINRLSAGPPLPIEKININFYFDNKLLTVTGRPYKKPG